MRVAASREPGVERLRTGLLETTVVCHVVGFLQLDPEESPDQARPAFLPACCSVANSTPAPFVVRPSQPPAWLSLVCNFAAAGHPITGIVTTFSWDEVVDFGGSLSAP